MFVGGCVTPWTGQIVSAFVTRHHRERGVNPELLAAPDSFGNREQTRRCRGSYQSF
jgi:hypothetical protein